MKNKIIRLIPIVAVALLLVSGAFAVHFGGRSADMVRAQGVEWTTDIEAMSASMPTWGFVNNMNLREFLADFDRPRLSGDIDINNFAQSTLSTIIGMHPTTSGLQVIHLNATGQLIISTPTEFNSIALDDAHTIRQVDALIRNGSITLRITSANGTVTYSHRGRIVTESGFAVPNSSFEFFNPHAWNDLDGIPPEATISGAIRRVGFPSSTIRHNLTLLGQDGTPFHSVDLWEGVIINSNNFTAPEIQFYTFSHWKCVTFPGFPVTSMNVGVFGTATWQAVFVPRMVDIRVRYKTLARPFL